MTDDSKVMVCKNCGACSYDRPDFAMFASTLREEASWIATIKRPPHDGNGQAVTDERELRELADRVERIGKRQGYC